MGHPLGSAAAWLKWSLSLARTGRSSEGTSSPESLMGVTAVPGGTHWCGDPNTLLSGPSYPITHTSLKSRWHGGPSWELWAPSCGLCSWGVERVRVSWQVEDDPALGEDAPSSPACGPLFDWESTRPEVSIFLGRLSALACG